MHVDRMCALPAPSALAAIDDDAAVGLWCSGVRFAHAVNSRALLAAALSDSSINFLECDVICDVADGATPMMGHDAGHASTFSFRQLLDEVVGRGKGLKVDIKEWHAVPGVLAALKAKQDELHGIGQQCWPLLRLQSGPSHFFRPGLLINADVLTGTTSAESQGCRFNPDRRVLSTTEQIARASEFIQSVGAMLPAAILSLGWTTAAEPTDDAGRRVRAPTYTSQMIMDMDAVIREFAPFGVAFTFAVRAQYLPRCWPLFERVLLRHPLTSVTLWSHEPATASELRFFRDKLDPLRTMYDLKPRAPGSTAGGGGSAWGDVSAWLPDRTTAGMLAGAAVGAALLAAVTFAVLRWRRGRQTP